MKRNLLLITLVIGLMLFFGIGVIMAEDTPVPTAEPAATLAVVAPDGSTTPVTVTLPASVDSALSNMERAFWVFVVICLVCVIVGMALHHNTQIRDMVSLETARSIYNETASFLNGVTQRIPGPGDDAIKNIALAIWDDQLKKWEAARSIPSTTTINVNPPAPDAQPTVPQQFTDALQATPG